MSDDQRSILFSERNNFSSMVANFSVPIVPSDVCSTCAFDKKPNIPIDVININTTTAIDRYAFINFGATFQF